MAAQLDAVGVVDEPVHDGVGDGGVAQRLMPLLDWQLAGDDGRAATRISGAVLRGRGPSLGAQPPPSKAGRAGAIRAPPNSALQSPAAGQDRGPRLGSRPLFPLLTEIDGHRIERRPPGFEFTPGLLGKISTYVVISPEGNPRVFAFMNSFLVESESDEDRLAAEALALIEDEVDASNPTTEQERTFEYSGGGWQEVELPRWWVSIHPTQQRRL